jgi:hypothetical protein
MIVTVINDPTEQQSILIVVLEPDNLKRMKKADPITMETKGPLGGVLPPIDYPQKFAVVIAAEEEEETKLYQAAGDGSLLHYIMRGYKFKRDLDGTERAFSMTQGREAEKEKL